MSLTLDEVVALYRIEGAALYGGEALTQLEHALQCAHLAERAGATPELTAACLLHDLGHLAMSNAGMRGADDAHQYAAMPLLRGLFSDAVLEPVRLHVEAKRYLCHAEPAYRDGLSAASRRSLELQGGVFDATAAAGFLCRPYAREALVLRRFDDLAKVPGQRTPGFAHFERVLRRCALDG